MVFPLAKRMKDLPSSPTIAMAAKARALKQSGADIVSLALGEPDFPSPPQALAGAERNVLEAGGKVPYPPIMGGKRLLEAIQKKFRQENGLSPALDELFVANGGKQLIFNAFAATLDPGDEVLIPAPYWVSYPLIARFFGAKPVFVPCPAEDNYRLSAQALEKAITKRTRWIVLNFPNNPTGAIMEEGDCREIAEVLRRHPGPLILSDEIYEHLTYDGKTHVPFGAAAPDLLPRLLTVNGMSKAYAMTGWRVGFAYGPKALIAAMGRIQGNSTSGVCGPAQGAALEVLEAGLKPVEEMRRVYEKRRTLMLSELAGIKGLSFSRPQGAFYVFADISGFLPARSGKGTEMATDAAFCEALLEEEHLAVVPGSAFGQPGCIRLSFAASDGEIVEGIKRLKRFTAGFASLKGRDFGV